MIIPPPYAEQPLVARRPSTWFSDFLAEMALARRVFDLIGLGAGPAMRLILVVDACRIVERGTYDEPHRRGRGVCTAVLTREGAVSEHVRARRELAGNPYRN